MARKITLPLLLLLLLFFFAGSLAEFSYTYSGSRGPLHWGKMSNEWKECRDGKSQSPVAIRSKTTLTNRRLGGLNAKYNQLTTCSIATSPYVFKVFISGAHCTLPLNKALYTLTDFHFHVPSEHTIDGVRFPLELHLVHRVPQNSSQIAVVSKLFSLGNRSSLLDQILKLQGRNATLHLSDYISLHGGYYRYVGSLTTPPCSQGIVWTVLRKTGSVSPSQIKRITAILQGRNARPLQRINKRIIYRHSS